MNKLEEWIKEERDLHESIGDEDSQCTLKALRIIEHLMGCVNEIIEIQSHLCGEGETSVLLDDCLEAIAACEKEIL